MDDFRPTAEFYFSGYFIEVNKAFELKCPLQVSVNRSTASDVSKWTFEFDLVEFKKHQQKTEPRGLIFIWYVSRETFLLVLSRSLEVTQNMRLVNIWDVWVFPSRFYFQFFIYVFVVFVGHHAQMCQLLFSFCFWTWIKKKRRFEKERMFFCV